MAKRDYDGIMCARLFQSSGLSLAVDVHKDASPTGSALDQRRYLRRLFGDGSHADFWWSDGYSFGLAA